MAVAGCRAPQVIADPYVVHDIPQIETFVAVLPSTPLAIAPVDNQWAAREPTATLDGQPYVLRVRGRRGQWLAVSPVNDNHEHCAQRHDGLRGLDLHLWIAAAAALPVLSKPKHLVYPDGTGWQLHAGVPLGPRVAMGPAGGELRAVQTDDYLTAIEAQADDVAQTYALSHVPPAVERPDAASYCLAPGTRLKLGDGELLRKQAAAAPWAVVVVGAPPTASGVLVELRERCGCFRVRVPEAALQTGGMGLLGMLAGTPAKGFVVAADTPLWWPDGRPAGVTTAALSLTREIGPSAGRRCFAWSLRPWWRLAPKLAAQAQLRADELPLCLEPNSVRRAPASLPAVWAPP
ncbi:MAG: hypothetical protein EXR77_04250 [Myxococcales bacterium]|nr:hypothetical protein [Myxococcales bacterium]